MNDRTSAVAGREDRFNPNDRSEPLEPGAAGCGPQEHAAATPPLGDCAGEGLSADATRPDEVREPTLPESVAPNMVMPAIVGCRAAPADLPPQADEAGSTDMLIIVHQAHSTPGRIGERLERRGYRLDVRRPALGDPLPETLGAYAGAVVFGGPMSANDDLPFIRTEIDFIEQALKEDARVLGICLGGQMMARALGARVSPHHEGECEIGYYPLAATDSGAELLNWPSHVYHWHSEGFELPQGADLLAKGEVFPNQAFRYGDTAYALQFHPEVTREMMCLWTVRGAHNLTKRGAQPGEAHLQGWQRYDAAVCRWLDGFLDMWLAAERAQLPPER